MPIRERIVESLQQSATFAPEFDWGTGVPRLQRWIEGLAPLCEHDAKAQARLAAELLRFDEVFDQDASIRFDDAL